MNEPLSESSGFVVGSHITARLKVQPEDFIVREKLHFELDDSPEHLWLLIRKRLCTTQDVIRDLARQTQLNAYEIGYSGLKDRFSVSEQWFSLPARHMQAAPHDGEHWHIVKARHHHCKLRVGTHRLNEFCLTLRAVKDPQKLLAQRLSEVQEHGFPNFFGEQRFGRQMENLDKARAWARGEIQIKNRRLQGIYLSSLRSYLFNFQLEERLHNDTWHMPLLGDRLMFSGGHSCFVVEDTTLAFKLNRVHD